MIAKRIETNPIIYPDMDDLMGRNINGPSLIKTPEWLENPLGDYYLYFAHHRGTYIRLAYSDSITGPWKTHRPGTLHLSNTNFDPNIDTDIPPHVASPDVHLAEEEEKIYMYYHGITKEGQKTRVAVSDDGLDFVDIDQIIGEWYFKMFPYNGEYYAVCRGQNQQGGGKLCRSKNRLSPFKDGPKLLDRMRHCAVHRSEDTLYIFYSNIGDRPETIRMTRIDLSLAWNNWSPSDSQTILEPEMAYEGTDCPLRSSKPGPINQRVRELRDPAIYSEGSELFLLYTVAGEHGIGAAKLSH